MNFELLTDTHQEAGNRTISAGYGVKIDNRYPQNYIHIPTMPKIKLQLLEFTNPKFFTYTFFLKNIQKRKIGL